MTDYWKVYLNGSKCMRGEDHGKITGRGKGRKREKGEGSAATVDHKSGSTADSRKLPKNRVASGQGRNIAGTV